MNQNKDIDGYQRQDSFDDRVDDDLCEHILQWLSIEDKIKLSEVSKQFRKCLQKLRLKQTVIKVDSDLDNDRDNEKSVLIEWLIEDNILFNVDKNRFINILKLFPNINEIIFGKYTKIYATNEVLELIIDNCNQLKRFQFDFKYSYKNLIENFGHKFGQHIKELNFVDTYGVTTNDIKSSILQKCQSLQYLSNVDFLLMSGRHNLLVKNLIKVEELYNIRSKQMFDYFIEQNPTLKDLDIELNLRTSTEMSGVFAKVSDLKNLEILSICLVDTHFYNKQMAVSIGSIGHKCKQLKSFSLSIFERKSFNTKLCFEAFKKFSNLKKLNIFSINGDKPKPTERLDSNCLKNCHQLIHLDLTSDQIDDHFFLTFNSIVPQLKTLRLSVNEDISDKTLESMAKLKHLESLLIRRFTGEDLSLITDLGFLSLINGCNRLAKLEIIYRTSITEKTIKALIQKAIKYPKIVFKYELYRLINEPKIEEILANNDKYLNNICLKGD